MLKGWDFEELADEWNLYLPDYLDDFTTPSTEDWMAMYLKFLFKIGIEKRSFKKAASDIRLHCKLIAEYDNMFPSMPIWEGYSKIESDETLIQYFIPVIGYAWT